MVLNVCKDCPTGEEASTIKPIVLSKDAAASAALSVFFVPASEAATEKSGDFAASSSVNIVARAKYAPFLNTVAETRLSSSLRS